MSWYSRYIFPHVLDYAMRRESLTPLRREVVGQAAGEVLEIGFGTGANLPFYPPAVTGLTVVEPNPGARRIAGRRIEEGRARGLAPARVEMCGAWADRGLPFEAGRFDTVVCTWTLCSVAEPGAALSEAYRVLKGGGRFLFVEHGRSPDARVARWQDRLTPVFRRVADGCHLNRDMEALVRGSPLRVVSLARFDLPEVPRIGGHMYRGEATK